MSKTGHADRGPLIVILFMITDEGKTIKILVLRLSVLWGAEHPFMEQAVNRTYTISNRREIWYAVCYLIVQSTASGILWFRAPHRQRYTTTAHPFSLIFAA